MMQNEMICTVCFVNKPRYFRNCKCLYCEDCKQKGSEICCCGGSGGWIDLNINFPEELKLLNVDNTQIMRKIMENTQEKIFSVLNQSFSFLIGTIEQKAHVQKQLQKFLVNKNSKILQENEELKKKTRSVHPFEIKENLDISSQFENLKYSTPRGVRPIVPISSNSKRPFDHEAFSSFFSKNQYN